MFGNDYQAGYQAGQANQPGYNTKTSSAVALLIVAVPALALWGGGGAVVGALGWAVMFIVLAVASLGAGLLTFLALSMLVALSKQPGRFGSPGRAFVYAATVSLVAGGVLMWMGFESVTLVAQSGAAAGGLTTAFAGGIGWLIWAAALPVVHGLWESPALDAAQGIGGVGSLVAAVLILAVPVLAFTFALRRLCGTLAALTLGILTQAGIAFVAMGMLSAALHGP